MKTNEKKWKTKKIRKIGSATQALLAAQLLGEAITSRHVHGITRCQQIIATATTTTMTSTCPTNDTLLLLLIIIKLWTRPSILSILSISSSLSAYIIIFNRWHLWCSRADPFRGEKCSEVQHARLSPKKGQICERRQRDNQKAHLRLKRMMKHDRST